MDKPSTPPPQVGVPSSFTSGGPAPGGDPEWHDAIRRFTYEAEAHALQVRADPLAHDQPTLAGALEVIDDAPAIREHVRQEELAEIARAFGRLERAIADGPPPLPEPLAVGSVTTARLFDASAALDALCVGAGLPVPGVVTSGSVGGSGPLEGCEWYVEFRGPDHDPADERDCLRIVCCVQAAGDVGGPRVREWTARELARALDIVQRWRQRVFPPRGSRTVTWDGRLFVGPDDPSVHGARVPTPAGGMVHLPAAALTAPALLAAAAQVYGGRPVEPQGSAKAPEARNRYIGLKGVWRMLREAGFECASPDALRKAVGGAQKGAPIKRLKGRKGQKGNYTREVAESLADMVRRRVNIRRPQVARKHAIR